MALDRAENGPDPKGPAKVHSASYSVNKLVFDTRRCLRFPAVRPVFYPRLPRKPLTNGSRRPPRSATSRLDISELGQPNDVLSNAPFHRAVRSTAGQVKNNTPSGGVRAPRTSSDRLVPARARSNPPRVRLFISSAMNGSLT